MARKTGKVKAVIINGKECSVKKSIYALNESPVFVSDYMSGKMAGIPSISTSNLENSLCNGRKNIPGMVCNKCFAAGTAARYTDLAENLKHNSSATY